MPPLSTAPVDNPTENPRTATPATRPVITWVINVCETSDQAQRLRTTSTTEPVDNPNCSNVDALGALIKTTTVDSCMASAARLAASRMSSCETRPSVANSTAALPLTVTDALRTLRARHAGPAPGRVHWDRRMLSIFREGCICSKDEGFRLTVVCSWRACAVEPKPFS